MPGVCGWAKRGFMSTNSDQNPDGQPAKGSPARAETSDLAARIRRTQEARQATQGGQTETRQGDMSALARGLRIGSEFVAAILVGSGIGFLIDHFAGTSPWALLIMFMMGFAAGILNVTRVVAELNAERSASEDDAGRSSEGRDRG